MKRRETENELEPTLAVSKVSRDGNDSGRASSLDFGHHNCHVLTEFQCLRATRSCSLRVVAVLSNVATSVNTTDPSNMTWIWRRAHPTLNRCFQRMFKLPDFVVTDFVITDFIITKLVIMKIAATVKRSRFPILVCTFSMYLCRFSAKEIEQLPRI